MYPSDIWCVIKCIRDSESCIFSDCCIYRKKYIRVFCRKQRHAMRRYTRFNGKDGFISNGEIIDLSRVYLKTGFKCYYCGRKMSIGISNSPDTCSIDHKLPIVKGGENTLNNLVFCCEECNVNKGHCESVLGGLAEQISHRFPKYRGENC